MRRTPRIRIQTRAVDEAERVGLGVAAEGGIVMPVPVVMQAGLQLEPLAGKTDVQRLRAGDGVRGAPRRPDHVPDGGLGSVRHAHRTVQMIGVDEERHGRGVDGIDDGDRPVHGRAAVPRRRDLGVGQ